MRTTSINLGSWNVGSVRDRSNVQISAWLLRFSDWDVSKLINAQMMFMGAEKFTIKYPE